MRTVSTRRFAVLFASAVLAIGVSGTEVPVDTPAHGPAPRSQWRAAVASDGEQYLVVWNDERTEAPLRHAARVSGSGTILDPNGIRVRSRSRMPAHVVWAGNAFFVVSEGDWDHERDQLREPELTRIDRDGRVLDPAPRTLPVLPQTGISVATDGRHVLIGYDRGFLYEKRVLVLDADGETIADFALSTAGETAGSGPPAIGWNGSVFAALWTGGTAVEGVRFGLNGTLGPARVAFGSSSQGTPQMASDGRDFIPFVLRRERHREQRVRTHRRRAAVRRSLAGVPRPADARLTAAGGAALKRPCASSVRSREVPSSCRLSSFHP